MPLVPTAGEYFVAAQELMADGDPSQVTIDALCKRVGATSGSFYHHFGSHAGFVEALVADWVDRVERSLDRAGIGGRRPEHGPTADPQPDPAPASPAGGRLPGLGPDQPHRPRRGGRVDGARIAVGRSIVQGVAPDLDADRGDLQPDGATAAHRRADPSPGRAAEVAARSLAAFVDLLEQAARGRSAARSPASA